MNRRNNAGVAFLYVCAVDHICNTAIQRQTLVCVSDTTRRSQLCVRSQCDHEDFLQLETFWLWLPIDLKESVNFYFILASYTSGNSCRFCMKSQSLLRDFGIQCS